MDARESKEVSAQGETAEALLVNWLNECLYVHDIEGFVVSRIEFALFEGKRVHSLLWGEDLDLTRHRVGTVVKAATFHELRIGQVDDGWEVRVILDI